MRSTCVDYLDNVVLGIGGDKSSEEYSAVMRKNTLLLLYILFFLYLFYSHKDNLYSRSENFSFVVFIFIFSYEL